MIERFLSPQEVADAFQLGRSTVYRRVADGTIPSVRIGNGPRAPIRIDPRTLEERLSQTAPSRR